MMAHPRMRFLFRAVGRAARQPRYLSVMFYSGYCIVCITVKGFAAAVASTI